MGFLDQLANLNPEQNQGLLAAAAQMLQQSGPSRMPTSFGQILGGGLQAYQGGVSDAQKRKLEELLGQQTTQMNSYKLRDAESDFANQEAQRQRAEQLRQFYIKQGGGAQVGQGPSAVGASPAPAMQDASVTPQAQSMGTPSAGNQNQGVYQQRMALASQLRNAGFSQEADAQEAAALKFQPAVDSWESIRSGGKIYKKPYFKDGTSGDFIPAELAEKLDKVNIGGKTLLTGEMSGNTYQTFNNSVDPNTAANNAVTIRGQDKTDLRAREANAIGKIPAGYRQLADGSLQAIPGGPADPSMSKEANQRTTDARDVLGILDQAEPLIKQSTSSYAGAGIDQLARVAGYSTPGAAAGSELQVLQGALISKMPKMSGPQSDKDVQLYREMAGRIGDTTLPADQRLAAVRQVRALNEKYLGNQGRQAQPVKRSALKGQVQDGYRFKGGDPSKQENWEKL